MSARRKPGARWRVLAHGAKGERYEMRDQGVFDELVVDDWIHLEQMGPRAWWMRLGESVFNIRLAADGTPIVRVTSPEGIAVEDGGWRFYDSDGIPASVDDAEADRLALAHGRQKRRELEARRRRAGLSPPLDAVTRKLLREAERPTTHPPEDDMSPEQHAAPRRRAKKARAR